CSCRPALRCKRVPEKASGRLRGKPGSAATGCTFAQRNRGCQRSPDPQKPPCAGFERGLAGDPGRRAHLLPIMVSEKRVRWSTAVFLIGFALPLAPFAWVMRPFFITVVLAASGAAILAPVQEGLARLLGGRRTTSAWIVTLVTVVLILAPLTL